MIDDYSGKINGQHYQSSDMNQRKPSNFLKEGKESDWLLEIDQFVLSNNIDLLEQTTCTKESTYHTYQQTSDGQEASNDY